MAVFSIQSIQVVVAAEHGRGSPGLKLLQLEHWQPDVCSMPLGSSCYLQLYFVVLEID